MKPLKSILKSLSDLKKIIPIFIVWRIILFFVAFLATFSIPTFGNRFPYVDRVLSVTNLPNWVWGFGNFDGVHYLRIAQNGYSAEFSQAFFPLYSFLIRIFNFFPKGNLDQNLYTDPSYFYTAVILSTMFCIAAVYFLYKLWGKEHGSKIAWLSILLLLSFPTAFYFVAIYSESLFLLLAVLTFWFVKKDKFILAGLMAALASATKVQGVLLGLFLAVELWQKYKNKYKDVGQKLFKDIIGVMISPLGLVAYMFYLHRTFGNPVYFLTAQPAFGAERSSLPFITLPQVIYRYIKILSVLPPVSFAFWNAVLEILVTLILIAGLIYAFKKIKFSYWIFVALAVILPTLTGTFSSMPRYALLAFPLLPIITRFNRTSKYIIIAQVALEIVLLMLFVRGYWVA